MRVRLDYEHERTSLIKEMADLPAISLINKNHIKIPQVKYSRLLSIYLA